MKYVVWSPTQNREAATSSDLPPSAPLAIVRNPKDRAERDRKSRQIMLEICVTSIVFVLLAVMSFYNLGQCPATWRDEGGALLLARTLAEDGVYAVKNYDRHGSFYETFGPVQSVGPTVVVPIAAVIKLFGYDLRRARLVPAIYLLLTGVLFYFIGRKLFGWKTAVVSVLLLFSSPSTDLIHWGRQALGEVPALAFFAAGWLAWANALRSRKTWLNVVAGVLFGAAIVTKTHYLIIGAIALAGLAIADIFWYRLRLLKGLLTVAVVASVCNATWWGWQFLYFGKETFFENITKMHQLATATGGFNPHIAVSALRQLFGFQSQLGHFYFFWGVPALVYAGLCSFKRDEESVMKFSLLCFASVWLAYWILWTTPWAHYGLPAFAITAIFVGQLWSALARFEDFSLLALKKEIAERPGTECLAAAMTVLAVLVIGFSFVSMWRNNVVRDNPRWFIYASDYVSGNVPTSSLIEIWDRELVLMTPHHYHITDPMLLHNARIPYIPPNGLSLGSQYFESYRPDYVIVGPRARSGRLYDTEYLSQHAMTVKRIGTAEDYCVLYRLDWH